MRSSSTASSVLQRSVSCSQRELSTSASSMSAWTTSTFRSPRRMDVHRSSVAARQTRSSSWIFFARWLSASSVAPAVRTACASTVIEYFVADAAPRTTW